MSAGNSPFSMIGRGGAQGSPDSASPLNILNESSPTDGSGSQATGYCSPDDGPFECDNCQFFEEPGTCNHPEVQADPEVNGEVDPEGCCNKFVSSHKENQESEHSEGNEEEEATSKKPGLAGLKKPKAAAPRGALNEGE